MAGTTPISTDIQPGQQTAIPASNYDINKDLGRVIDRTNVVDAPTAPNLLFNDGAPNTLAGNSKVNPAYAAMLGAIKNTPTNFLTDFKYTNKSVADPYLTDAYGGFTPDDPNISNWYGENQSWVKQMGNRFGKLAVTTVGSFANSLMDIPNMISAAKEGNIDKVWNNPTNTWATDMQNWAENAMPNYETNWERQHPFLNLVPFYGNAGNGWGNILQQTGFTIGAIGGSLVEDAVVGAVTGGVGEVPLAALQINKAVYRLGKLINFGEEGLAGLKGSIKSADDIIKGLKGIDKFNYAVRKGLWGANMITSGVGEAAFEGLDGFNQLNKDLTQEYFNNNGKMPDYEAQQKIYDTAKTAGNTRFLLNTALLAATNSIQWGSLLKPFNVIKDAVEAEAKTGIRVALKEGSRDIFEAVQPTNTFARIGKAITSSKPVELLTESLSEGFEEGSQFAIQNGVDDYYKRKYHQPSIDQTNNFMKSFGLGMSKTLGTQEGWENIIDGVLGGALYSAGEHIYHKIRGIEAPDRKQQIQDVLKGLNAKTLTGVFENKYGEQVAADAIQDDMLAAAKANNPFLFKNYQHEQMVNFVVSGIEQNKYETRLDQLDELNKLSQDEFQKEFNIPQTDANKKLVADYVSTLKSTAASIKDIHDRVDRTFVNPFNYKGTGNYKNAEQKAEQDKENEKYLIYQDTKNQLTYSMSVARDSNNRISQMRSEIAAHTAVNADEVEKLGSDVGMHSLKQDYLSRISILNEGIKLGDKESQKEKDNLLERVSLIDDSLDQKDEKASQKSYQDLLFNVFNKYAQDYNQAYAPFGAKKFDPTIIKDVMGRSKDIAYLNSRNKIAADSYARLTTKGGFKKLFDNIADIRSKVQVQPITLTPNTVQPQNPQVNVVAQQAAQANGLSTGTGLAASQQQGQGELTESTQVLDDEKKRTYYNALLNVIDGKDKAASDDLDNVDELSTVDDLKMTNPNVNLSEYTQVKSSDGKNYYIHNSNVAAIRAQAVTLNTAANAASQKASKPIVPPSPPQPQPAGAGAGREALRTEDYFNKALVPADLKVPFQEAIQYETSAEFKADMTIRIQPLSPERQQAYNDQKANNTYTQLKGYPGVYSSLSPIDMSILHTGDEVAKLATPDRLLFNVNNQLVTLDKLTAQQYANFTSRPAAQYAADLEQYNAMVALKNYFAIQFKNNNNQAITLSEEQLEKLVDVKLTYGELDLIPPGGERPLYSELENTTHVFKGSNGQDVQSQVIISIPRVYNNDIGGYVKSDIMEFIYSPAFYDNNADSKELKAKIAGDVTRIHALGTRYVGVTQTPDGALHYVALTPGQLGEQAESALFNSLKDRAQLSGETNFAESTKELADGQLLIGDQVVYYKYPNAEAKAYNDTFNEGIDNQLFISDPDGKKNFNLSVSPIGAIRMEIYDKDTKAGYTLYIAPTRVATIKNLGEMIDLFNKEAVKVGTVKKGMTQEQIDKATAFAALKVNFSASQFRENIAKDSETNADAAGNALSSATTTNVFKNGTLRITPNYKEISSAYKAAGGTERNNPANQNAVSSGANLQTSQDIMAAVIASQTEVQGRTADQQFYIIRGENYRRVTNVIPNDFDGDSSLYENARVAGSTVDGIVRDFFSGKTATKPAGISDEAHTSIIKALTEIKKTIEDRGEKFISNNIVLFDPVSKIAGEVDILSVDKDGNYSIYDIKTAKDFGKYDDSYNGKMTKRQNHTNQLSAYSNLFQNEFGVKPKRLGILPFQIAYDGKGNITSVEKQKGINIVYNPEISSVVPLTSGVFQMPAPSIPVQEMIAPSPITLPSKGIFGGLTQVDTDDQGNPLGMVSPQEIRDAKATSNFNQESNEDKVFTSADEALGSVGVQFSNTPQGTVFRDAETGEILDNLSGMSARELAKSMGLNLDIPKGANQDIDFDFKLGENGVKELNTILDVEKARQYISDNLPSFIKMADISEVLDRIAIKGQVWGAFSNGVIYLNSDAPAGTEYHEAFHGVFRMLLSDAEIDRYLSEAQKGLYNQLKSEGKSINQYLKERRDLGLYNTLSNSQALDRLYEEYMADKFQGWKAKKESAGIFDKLFDAIRRFFKWFSKSGKDLDMLFRDIDTGVYKYHDIAANRFTTEMPEEDYGNPEIALSLIPARPGVMQVGKGQITIKRNMDPKTSTQTVQSVASYYNTYRMLDKYRNISDDTLLNTILDDLQGLYSINNPLYAGKSEAEMNRILSSDQAYVYSNPESRDIIKKGAIEYVNTIKYIEQFREEDKEDSEQDKGQPSTGYNNTSENIGGLSSLPGLLRQYIGFTSYDKVDEFGNSQLIEGVPTVNTVDSRAVYYGLLRSVANITDPIKFFQKMIMFSNGNEQSRHFVEKFIKETGLNVQALFEENRLEATINPALVEMVRKGFNKFRVDYLFNEVDVKKSITKSYPANRKNVENTQFDKWSNEYGDNYAKYSDDAQKAIRDNVNDIRSIFDERIVTKYDATKLSDDVTRVQNTLSQVGIRLSSEYIKYSILSKNARLFDALNEKYKKEGVELQFDDPKNKFINKQDYEYVQIMKTADETTLNGEDLEQLTRLLTGGSNPYFKDLKEVEQIDDNTQQVTKVNEEIDTAMIGRLLNIAKGNSLFDETVGESSFTNAEDKIVYGHQDGTFNINFSYQLRDAAFRKQLREQGYREATTAYRDAYDSEWLTDNFLMKSPDFEAIADNLLVNRIDGLKAVETNKAGKVVTAEFRDQKDGITYGHYSPREFLINFMNIYSSYAKTQRNGKTSVVTTPHLIRVLEASSTGDTVNLPILSDMYKASGVTQKVKDIIFNEFKREFNRINRVNTEIGTIKSNVVENYHTGNFGTDSQGNEDRSVILKGYRGLQFTESFTALLPKTVLDRMAGIARSSTAVISEQDEKYIKDQLAVSLNKMVDDTLNLLVTEGIINKDNKGKYSNVFLHSDYFNGNESINLSKDKFTDNVGHVIMNNFINTLAYNQILHGDPALSLKDAVDAVKRAKGDNAAIKSMRTDLIAPELGITQPFTHSNIGIFKEPISADGTKIADAQMYTTVTGLRYTLWGLAQLTPRVARVLDALEAGENIHSIKAANGKEFDAIFDKDNGLLRWDEMTNSMKLIFKDGKSYFKMSVVVLQPNLTSMKDENGNWKAIPGWETLHNLRTRMEDQSMHFAAPESASKMMTMDVGRAKDFSDLVGHPYDNTYFGLQTANPSNKLEITTPTQLLQLIDGEQDDESEVSISGTTYTIGQVRDIYQTAIANKVSNNFEAARNEIYNIQDFNNDVEKSIAEGKVTPQLANFQKRAISTLEASGGDAQLLDFFSLDENGIPKYNLNMSATKFKFQQLYLAYFSKGVLSQKNPGYTVALFSGIDTKTIRRAKRIENGVVVEWDHIRRDHYVNNRQNVQAETILHSIDQVTEEGQLYLDELRHNVTEYDSDGNDTGRRYSEMMLPPHFKEFLDIADTDQIPESIAMGLGVRIPSQDKNSFMALRIIDFLPANLGSTAMFSKDLVRLSGADFDLDKEYITRYDFYTEYRDGKPQFRKYGDARSSEAQWGEYKDYMKKNNKTLKGAISEIMGQPMNAGLLQDINLSPVEKENVKNSIVEAALKQVGLPSTQEEFEEASKTKELNNGILNNKILDSYISLLTNKGIREIADESSSMEALSEIQGRGELTLRDKNDKVVGKVFGKKSSFPGDSMGGQYQAFKNNSAGKDNIGIDVNASLIYSILNKAGIKVRETEKIQPFRFDGMTFDSFGGNNELNLDSESKQFDGRRTNGVYSALTSAATDEAKEQLNALYNLSVDALKIVNYMVGLKVPLTTAVYMVNQPGISTYLNIKSVKQNTLQTPQEERLFKKHFEEEAVARLEKSILDYHEMSDDDLYANLQQSGIFELQCD